MRDVHGGWELEVGCGRKMGERGGGVWFWWLVVG